MGVDADDGGRGAGGGAAEGARGSGRHDGGSPGGVAEHVAVLARTPGVLDAWLRGLPDAWLHAREAPGTWSPVEVLGHLIEGEESDWMPRVAHLLEHGEAEPFTPFDRDAHLARFEGETVDALLDRFATRRRESLDALAALGLGDGDARLARRGTHPAFGAVTLDELLATWVVHDLGHLGQIARVMARRWGERVGPWREYLPVLHPRGR